MLNKSYFVAPCGLTCLNGGVLNSQACTCNCINGYSGYNCGKAPCSITCQNGGILNSQTCTCQCINGYTGSFCEKRN